MDIGSKSEEPARFRLGGLTFRFVLATAVTLSLATIFLGIWVGRQVSDLVLVRNSESAALYMTSFLEPAVQGLAPGDRLTPEQRAILETVASDSALRRHVRSIKLWAPDGTILFATDSDLIGRKFDTGEIAEALAGHIGAYYDQLDDEENVHERALGMPLYEVYVPLRDRKTGAVVAVGEFYEDATVLREALADAAWRTWSVTGSVGLAVFVILLVIVRGGDMTIRRQERRLASMREEQEALRAHNEALAADIRAARADLGQIEERIQRRLGLELHDGPAQLLTAILFNIEAIKRMGNEKASGEEARRLVEELRAAAAGALDDLRAISHGLFLATRGREGRGGTAVAEAIEAHEGRFGINVDRDGVEMLEALPPEQAGALAAVVGEALTNATKHAPQARQWVRVRAIDGGAVRVEIGDNGPGIKDARSGGIGLDGMRMRIEEVGGRLEIFSRPGSGTVVEVTIPASGGKAESGKRRSSAA